MMIGLKQGYIYPLLSFKQKTKEDRENLTE